MQPFVHHLPTICSRWYCCARDTPVLRLCW